MSQPVPGGGVKLDNGIFIAAGGYDPNTRVDLLNNAGVNCQAGSLFLRTDAPNAGVYVCTVTGAPPTANGQPATSGTWTLIS